MLNTLKIYNQLSETLDAAAKAIADVLRSIYEDLQNSVIKAAFQDLTNTINELAEA